MTTRPRAWSSARTTSSESPNEMSRSNDLNDSSNEGGSPGTAGVIASGVLACLAGLAGILSLGMTGLAWYNGELRETTSYDSTEAGIGYGIACFLWVVAAALIIVAFVLALIQARRQPERRKFFLALAGLVPAGCAVVVAIGWFLLLAPGGATLAP